MIDQWLRTNITLRGTVIHERLVAEYGYQHSYQRVKMYLREARPRIAAELAGQDENPLHGLHRRFEVTPGAQGQSTGVRKARCWPTWGSARCTRST